MKKCTPRRILKMYISVISGESMSTPNCYLEGCGFFRHGVFAAIHVSWRSPCWTGAAGCILENSSNAPGSRSG